MINRKHALLAALVVLAIFAVIVRSFLWAEIRAYRYRNYTEVRVVNDSNWFDYPVGYPNARGYYNAQKFGGANSHLGEDWNGMGGGNSDYGDGVYSIADGTVSCAADCGLGWGNVVRIIHPVDSTQQVEAVYAHLADMTVSEGQTVRRGQMIGTIGNADGKYLAHLHFEIRTKVGRPLGGGYGTNREDAFCDPTEFIDRHRERRQ